MGRPARGFTVAQRKMVEAMAAYGIPQRDIAGVIGCARVTLRAHCAEELDLGSTKATVKVAEFLFQKATGQKGHEQAAVTAAIFWMKARAGWKDRHDVVHQNPDGTALFEDWPDAKLAAVTRRALDILEKKGKREKKATR